MEGKTIGELYDPAMTITDQATADAYFQQLVARHVDRTRQQAERIERHNLAYYAGYCSHEIRERVERLFFCKHPVFGSIAENGPPTAEEAFAAGIAAAEPPRSPEEGGS